MNECNLTPFGLSVKTELLHRGKPQRWLEELVTEKTGLYMDSSYMRRILTGQNSPDKIISAIREILDLKEVATDENQ